MLPTQRTTLSQSLADLVPATRADQEVRLRVGLQGGTVLEGVLISVSPQHLSLRLPDAQARLVPADEIHSIHLAVRRPFRELLVVTCLILGCTTAVVAIASVTRLRPELPTIGGGLAVLGFAGISVLQRRTRLGPWLTSWRTLFDAGSR